jgi:hypothetical protein
MPPGRTYGGGRPGAHKKRCDLEHTEFWLGMSAFYMTSGSKSQFSPVVSRRSGESPQMGRTCTPNAEDRASGEPCFAQFGSMCAKLGIRIIAANSRTPPQLQPNQLPAAHR